MAVNLEARELLLDHCLVEFAWQLAAPNKMSADGVGKQPLRELLVARRLETIYRLDETPEHWIATLENELNE